jgi:hypothetical protein
MSYSSSDDEDEDFEGQNFIDGGTDHYSSLTMHNSADYERTSREPPAAPGRHLFYHTPDEAIAVSIALR